MFSVFKTALPVTLALCLTAVSAHAAEPYRAKTEKVAIKVETLTSGLEYPWAVEPLGDGGYLITERPGRIRIYKDGTLSEPLAGVPKVWAQSQGGLLDIVRSPGFASDRTLYFTATQSFNGGVGIVVFSATLTADERALQKVKPIFKVAKTARSDHNFGSRLAFSPDGKLFVTIGDQGIADTAQDPFDHRGSVLRLNPDGSVPADNPFADGKKALAEIYSTGHRNPQGIVFDPKDGTLYTVEHGPKGGDEVNAPEPGKNYGWPHIAYGVNYDGSKVGIGTEAPGYEQPLHYWDPSIAPSELVVYRGKMFPEWDGDFLVSALKFMLVTRLEREDSGKITGEERFLEDEFGRLRDLTVDEDGSLLLVNDEEDGKLLRVTRDE